MPPFTTIETPAAAPTPIMETTIRGACDGIPASRAAQAACAVADGARTVCSEARSYRVSGAMSKPLGQATVRPSGSKNALSEEGGIGEWLGYAAPVPAGEVDVADEARP